MDQTIVLTSRIPGYGLQSLGLKKRKYTKIYRKQSKLNYPRRKSWKKQITFEDMMMLFQGQNFLTLRVQFPHRKRVDDKIQINFDVIL